MRKGKNIDILEIIEQRDSYHWLMGQPSLTLLSNGLSVPTHAIYQDEQWPNDHKYSFELVIPKYHCP
jgi:hypothetical protein